MIGHDGHYQKVSTTDAILSAYHDTLNWQEHVQYGVSLYDAKLHMACEIKVGYPKIAFGREFTRHDFAWRHIDLSHHQCIFIHTKLGYACRERLDSR